MQAAHATIRGLSFVPFAWSSIEPEICISSADCGEEALRKLRSRIVTCRGRQLEAGTGASHHDASNLAGGHTWVVGKELDACQLSTSGIKT